jgi:hypothetical protein
MTMKQLTVYTIIALIGITIQSCSHPSSNSIEKISKPDRKKVKDFGINISGDIVYQFYEKYGFTDIEEHQILVVKSDNVSFLTSTLPFDSIDIRRLQRIDLRKFIKDKPVDFEPEKIFQEDIRIESKEFDARKEMPVFHDEGKYGITLNDSVETVYVFDKRTELMYVESRKLK